MSILTYISKYSSLVRAYALFSTLLYRGSYISVHVLLNFLNELGKKRYNARITEHLISFSQ